MKNIIDYLKEVKNIPFSEEPFNELDGLLLCELVYADFENILDENSREDVTAINKAFRALHSDEEIAALTAVTQKNAPVILQEMADSVRFAGTKFKNYVTDISLKAIKQFGALTFELPDGTDFISYRGTNGTVAGWMEDFKFSFSTTDGQDDAVDYINRYHYNNPRPIRTGGHSKGGNLAVYAAVKCARSIQDNIERIFSFDGPGFKMDVLDSEEYKRILPRVLSVIPKECAVGIMMNNHYRTIITDSDGRAIYQHDPYQWHVENKKFVELPERSELSFFFERVLNNWLVRCDENKREQILDIIFTLIMDNGIADGDETRLTSEFSYNVLLNTPKLTRSDKLLLVSSISDIVVSTSVIATDEFRAKSAAVADELRARSTELRIRSAFASEDLKAKSAEVKDEIKTRVSEEIKAKSAEIRIRSAFASEDLKEKSAEVKDEIKTRVSEEIKAKSAEIRIRSAFASEDLKAKSAEVKEELKEKIQQHKKNDSGEEATEQQ